MESNHHQASTHVWQPLTIKKQEQQQGSMRVAFYPKGFSRKVPIFTYFISHPHETSNYPRNSKGIHLLGGRASLRPRPPSMSSPSTPSYTATGSQARPGTSLSLSGGCKWKQQDWLHFLRQTDGLAHSRHFATQRCRKRAVLG